ncbi:MAG: bifunctional 5,10-methylenetetrahydrofolate dehydrogenase/5,10-methenyltetrahydrofolate cyclohydrolase [Elusimicrobiota bacterium]
MSASIFRGSDFTAGIQRSLAQETSVLSQKLGRPPKLAVFFAQGNAAAKSYVASKTAAGLKIGVDCLSFPIASETTTVRTRNMIESAVKNNGIDAVILDLPLHPAIDATQIKSIIPPGKDAEGLCPENYGRLFLAKTYDETLNMIVPATARACAEIARVSAGIFPGMRAVVIGRSPIVGRAAAQLLSLLDLTVTICHSKTSDLESEIGRADVVIAAAGKAGLVRGNWIKKGAIVIDAGINVSGGRLQGDVDYEPASEIASFVTPVPGGVGPVTTIFLLSNVVALAKARLPNY